MVGLQRATGDDSLTNCNGIPEDSVYLIEMENE